MLAPNYLGAELLGSEFSLPGEPRVLDPGTHLPTLPNPVPSAFFFFLNNSIYLFIFGCAGLCCYTGFSLVVASRDYSLVVVLRLFTAVTSLVSEHGP